MTVYFSFMPTRRARLTVVRVERAGNLEVPARALRERVRDKRGRTFYDGVVLQVGQQPVEEFPQADGSARMLVWRRPAKEPPPDRKSEPDEVWTLSELGAVVRSYLRPPG